MLHVTPCVGGWPRRLVAGLAAMTLLGACASNDKSAGSETEELQPPLATAAVVPPQVTVPQPPPPSQTAPPPEVAQAPAVTLPPRPNGAAYTLHIPSLGLRAPVVAVKSENRVLNPPKNPKVVGWWSEGAMPGAKSGSAVLVGHTVSRGGGAFDDVDKLHAGDTVEVSDDARTLTYRVDTVQILPKGEIANQAEKLFDQSVDGRLVLVTCEDWDGKVYHSNVIAMAYPA
jgi:LPXTG-site transpeptidase (sortase) family protein